MAHSRVSTDEQGRGGLGLEAQRRAVRDYLNGGQWDLLAESTEVETGKGWNAPATRPQLAAAVALCRKRKATLVIAKLNRLARNVAFVSGLMESRVPFVAAGLPFADRFMRHVHAAVAKEEARTIGERTKAALTAAKARGVRLGEQGRINALRQKAETEGSAQQIAPTIEALRAEGHTSVRALVEELNRRAIPTPKGARWHVPTVYRLLSRIGAAS